MYHRQNIFFLNKLKYAPTVGMKVRKLRKYDNQILISRLHSFVRRIQKQLFCLFFDIFLHLKKNEWRLNACSGEHSL